VAVGPGAAQGVFVPQVNPVSVYLPAGRQAVQSQALLNPREVFMNKLRVVPVVPCHVEGGIGRKTDASIPLENPVHQPRDPGQTGKHMAFERRKRQVAGFRPGCHGNIAFQGPWHCVFVSRIAYPQSKGRARFY